MSGLSQRTMRDRAGAELFINVLPPQRRCIVAQSHRGTEMRAVPGHGPVVVADDINRVRDYLVWVQAEASARYERGMSPEDAVRDINLGRFGELDERGRIAQNVLAVYYELDPTLERVDTREVFRRIAELEGFTE